jgi:hypothetical protein
MIQWFDVTKLQGYSAVQTGKSCLVVVAFVT